MNTESLTSQALAPEDIGPGDYVCVLHTITEHLPLYMLLESAPCARAEPVRLSWLSEDGAAPMKVVDVCLPLVLVRGVDGKHRTMDVRRCRLARLSPGFGKRVFKRLRREARRPGGETIQLPGCMDE